jgi:hypothetical protein
MQKGNKNDEEKKKWKIIAGKTNEIPSIFNFVKKPLEAGLWCLYVGRKVYNYEYLLYEDMEMILQDYLDVPITANKIKKAFARAGNKIIKGKRDEGYKISQPGEIYLKSLKKDEPISVFYLRPAKPLQAKHTLEALIKSIPKGELRICDPYYGISTFHALEMILKYHRNVKFLTSLIGGGEKKSSVQQIIKDFKTEYGSRAELKIINKNEIHDRYILTSNSFLIIGQGFKDLGNKESLIIAVEDRYGKDIRETLIKEFDRRWQRATTL